MQSSTWMSLVFSMILISAFCSRQAIHETCHLITAQLRQRHDDNIDMFKCKWKVRQHDFCFIFSSPTYSRILPPYIIYAGIHLWNTWICKNSFPGTRYNTSLSGWVEEHIFFDWLSQHFIPYVSDIPKPVLLIFDGHKAHISTPIIKLAMDHRVELLCLPPHSTTVLPALDVVTLTKIKTAWRKLLTTHNTQTNSEKIDKKRFSYFVSEKL